MRVKPMGLVPRILLEFRIRSQLSKWDRHQNAIGLGQARRALEEPRLVVFPCADEILTALRFGSELEQTLLEDRVARLCLCQRRCQRLGRIEHARTDGVHKRHCRWRLTEFVQRLRFYEVYL